MDGNVYSVANWNNSHLFNESVHHYGVYRKMVESVRELLGSGAGAGDDHCTAMWLYAPSVDESPWVFVPCSKKYPSWGFICEYTFVNPHLMINYVAERKLEENEGK